MTNLAAVMLTDYDWFYNLSHTCFYQEINFWTPTPWNVNKLVPGSKVIFLLKEKFGRKICGFGHFKEYKNMSVEDAWKYYGLANGVKNLNEIRERVSKYTNKNSKMGYSGEGHLIGCVILSDVVFFQNDKFLSDIELGIKVPKQVVKFKYVDLNFSIFDVIVEPQNSKPFELPTGEKRYKQVNISDRKGQFEFRNKVLKAYQNKCCITGETVEDVIEAAHIHDYKTEDSNSIQNGLALRVDIHRLYDAGLLTIDETYTVHISPYNISTYYQQFEGRKICLPAFDPPSIIALKWHDENYFRR